MARAAAAQPRNHFLHDLQVQQHRVAPQRFDRADLRHQVLLGDVGRSARLEGLDHEIAERGVRAQQHVALLLLGRRGLINSITLHNRDSCCGSRLRDITVAIDVPDDLPRVEADEARLEQVLMNLILNARDALDEREGDEPEKEILIRARPVTLPGEEPGVSIEITDNGPGIPREVLDRVFEPFFTTKEVGKGTGLGLSISYGLVREFGGTLEVQSRPGEGSSFTVLLKAAPAADDPSTGSEIDA